ncbi:transporter substrate-binding domain-containing protein [Thioclava sp. BHET1]|nr:transporter substrate-binding domain-containing protein [Thioclava sp. BHET1]
MKLTLLALAATAAMSLGAAASAQTVKVGVASEPYPPFTVPDASGHWSGWEVDIMNAICKDQKLDCVITPVAWDGIIPALTSGQIDVIMSSMSITAARKKVIDFSDKYYETPAAMATAKDANFDTSPKGMKGKIIGIEISSTNAAYTHKFYDKSGATLKTYQTQDEADQDLAAGRIDATIADEFALQGFLDTDQGKECCKIAKILPYDKETLGDGIGAGFRKSDTALREKFNKGIADIRKDGAYQKITKKYFKNDIFGG